MSFVVKKTVKRAKSSRAALRPTSLPKIRPPARRLRPSSQPRPIIEPVSTPTTTRGSLDAAALRSAHAPMPRHASHTPAPTTQPRKGIGAKRKIGSAIASSARSRTRRGLRGSEVTEAGDDQAEADADAHEEADDPERDSQAGERADAEADRGAEDDRGDDQAARHGRGRPSRSAGTVHRRIDRWNRGRACRSVSAPDGGGGNLRGT